MKIKGHIRSEFVLFVALGAVVWAVFGQALFFDFVAWDDDTLLCKNPHFGGLNWERLFWMFGDMKFLWRYLPLTWLTWSINYELGGLNPLGYHLGNLLLHAANAGLVFVVLRKLFLSRPQPTAIPIASNWLNVCAAIAAAIWAVHPLRVEPVVWATDRMYGLALFFLLLGFWCHLHWLWRPEGAPSRQRFYWFGVVLFAASLLSYQTGLGYLVVLVVLDFYPLRRFGPGWGGLSDKKALRIHLEKAPYLVAALLVAGLALFARFSAGGTTSMGLDQFGVWQRAAQASYIWAYYTWKPFLPLNLSPLYTTLLAVDPTKLRFVFSAAGVLGISLLLWVRRDRWPGLLALWLCHLALLAPVLGLTEHPHFSNDRYSYFDSICWSVLIVALLLRAGPRLKTRAVMVGAAACLTVLLGFMAHWQAGVWKDSVSLFEDTLSKVDDAGYRYSTCCRLADAYAAAGRKEKALEASMYLTTLRPDDPATHRRMGEALFNCGRFAEAQAAYECVLKVMPNNADLQNACGVTLGAQGRFEEALQRFREAMRLEPENAAALQNIALALTKQGKTNEAKPYFEKAFQIQSARLASK